MYKILNSGSLDPVAGVLSRKDQIDDIVQFGIWAVADGGYILAWSVRAGSC